MNTVKVEEPNRTVSFELNQRAAQVEDISRNVITEDILRTVDVTMTYTLEEFYIISIFQIGQELKEGPLWASE